jgi:hypothetical protein
MNPRKDQKREPKAGEIRKQEPKPRLWIVRLEERIAPALTSNHNETLTREPAKTEPKAAEPCKGETKPRLRIVRLEERIAPGLSTNHNESLLRDVP